jgi:AraC family transcriptional regulator
MSSKHSLAPGEFFGSVASSVRLAGLHLTDVVHRGERELPTHEHELAYFSLLLDGGYSETVGGKTLVYGPASVGFHPAALSHRDEIPPGGGRFFCVELEASWLERIREYELRLRAEPDIYQGEAAILAFRLHREMRARDDWTELAVEGLALEMLAALARGRRLPSESRPPAWLTRVKERLREEIRPRPSLSELARDASVHPVYMARAFRRFERCSLGQFARRVRVERACCEILRGDRSLADIALETGFADQAHFTRVFKRLLGVSPGAFRAQSAQDFMYWRARSRKTSASAMNAAS